MTSWPFAPLQPRGYRLILADPPWKFATYNDANQSKKPERYYDTLAIGQIMDLPVGMLAREEGCALALWTTWPFLEQAFKVIQAWGFSYSTGGPWMKLTRDGDRVAFGTGYVLRSVSEPLLLAWRGKPVITKPVHGIIGEEFRQVEEWAICGKLREHSRKPDQQYLLLEQLFPGPRCELFARSERTGWAAWGNETDKFAAAAP